MSSEENFNYLPDEILNCLSDNFKGVNKKDKVPVPYKITENRGKDKLQANKSILPITQLKDDREKELRKFFPHFDKNLIDTMIETKYFMKKDEVIKYIHYVDREMLSFGECDNNQILFPTQYPQSRYEIKCLESTLYKMLEEKDNPDKKMLEINVETDSNIKELIKLVENMHGIYSLVLHEIARQIYTNNEARGKTILELREKYENLAHRIPKELSLLIEEAGTQKTRDMDLKASINEFQESIRDLTNELKDVNYMDMKITKSAETIQDELQRALQDSDQSKESLNMYKELYELQRLRLDNEISSINMEKEEWANLAFALSLKITEETILNTSKKLRLCTKQLTQQAHHFSIFISDRDTLLTSKVQKWTDNCLKVVTNIHIDFNRINNNFMDFFQYIKEKYKTFREHEWFNDKNKLDSLINQINSLKGFLVDESMQLFFKEISQEKLTENQDNLKKINDYNDKLQKETIEVLKRQRIVVNSSEFQVERTNEINLPEFENNFHSVELWSVEFQNQLDKICQFQPFFNDLSNRIQVLENKAMDVKEKLCKSLLPELVETELTPIIDDLYLETFENSPFDNLQKNQLYTEFNLFYNDYQYTTTKFCANLDNMDADLISNVNEFQENVTKWMIEALFLLTNKTTIENTQVRYNNLSKSYDSLINHDGIIYSYLKKWTIIMADNSDSKSEELKEYEELDNQWKEIAEILIKDIQNNLNIKLQDQKTQSENEIANIKFEDVENVLETIKKNSTDSDLYLALEAVDNLKEEVMEVLKRIADSSATTKSNNEQIHETRAKIIEMEQKLSDVTAEYQEFIKQ